jgi:putative aldouronate transport system permease protein
VKRTVQTIIYLPYFVSWVIMAGIITDILSPTNGLVNQFLGNFGIKPIFFLGNSALFPYVYRCDERVEGIRLGDDHIPRGSLQHRPYDIRGPPSSMALAGGRQMLHVTLPGVAPTIVLVATLSLGNVLNAGFDPNLQPSELSDTENRRYHRYARYRYGIQNAQFGLATAAGLFKSAISCFLIIASYRLAYRFTGYRII